MPSEQGVDNGDSCCHEIGMSLTDECSVLDKPHHGWIASDLLHLVRGTRVHRPMTVGILLSKRTTSSMVSASVRRACERKLPTTLITCFCPHLEHARCHRKNHANVATTPCPSSQSTVPTFALASEARWASLSSQVPDASLMSSLLWHPRSVPQSCRLKVAELNTWPPSRVDRRNPSHW